MAYATPEQLLAYVGESVSLPSAPEQERLLERASELIDQVTLLHIDVDDPETGAAQAEAAQLATCAQVEYWLSAGADSVDVSGPVQGYQVGSLQVQYGAGNNRVSPGLLAIRAKRHLFLAGLLARRVLVR